MEVLQQLHQSLALILLLVPLTNPYLERHSDPQDLVSNSLRLAKAHSDLDQVGRLATLNLDHSVVVQLASHKVVLDHQRTSKNLLLVLDLHQFSAARLHQHSEEAQVSGEPQHLVQLLLSEVQIKFLALIHLQVNVSYFVNIFGNFSCLFQLLLVLHLLLEVLDLATWPIKIQLVLATWRNNHQIFRQHRLAGNVFQ